MHFPLRRLGAAFPALSLLLGCTSVLHHEPEPARTEPGANEVLARGQTHPLVGRPAPELPRLRAAAGPGPRDSEAAGGAPPGLLVVEFWASWCASCRDALPNLTRAQAGGDFAALAISIDASASSFRRGAGAISEHPPLLWDKGQRLAAAYKLNKLPSTFVIGIDGTVLAALEGRDANDPVALAPWISQSGATPVARHAQ